MPDVKHLTGTEFHGWTMGRVLGEGADGIVYAAVRGGVERAIKVFLPESLGRNGRAQARERLELQLSLAGQETHPNLVRVYDGGEDASLDTLFLIMDLVPGTSLDRLLPTLPTEAIPDLVRQLADAALFLEQHDLYHRDIKPANVVISDDFTQLTLLDLGIVYHIPTNDDGRLSGDEFVATLRYSPPEFVWRTEESQEAGAWRAVTFYQIGATVHDMIMRKPLFDGMDKPRAKLYDCVRDHTPQIKAAGVPGWLQHLTEACLLKDWRQRLHFVRWESFQQPAVSAGTTDRELSIRLRQVRAEEVRQARAKQATQPPVPNREHELWSLNSTLFMEVRKYLIASPIFPRCSSTEKGPSERHYVSEYLFECEPTLGFSTELLVRIDLEVAPMLEAATRLTFEASINGTALVNATWTEMFTAETAFSLCKQALLDTVDQLIPRD